MSFIGVICRRVATQRLKKCGLSYCQWRVCSTANSTQLMSQLVAKIRFNGPITVADYMNEALTHASEGYYIHKDVFGQKGDFTTSPEISQMFGEMVAIWFVNEWLAAGSPSNIQIVELGPGRGTMMDDMLRAFSKFPDMKQAVSVHLIEVSQKLSEIQESKLSGSDSIKNSSEMSVNKSGNGRSAGHYKSIVSKHGSPVYWYRDVREVPRGFTMFVAHEFFDALPIHKFQKTDAGWREVLIDHDTSEDQKLQFVLAPAQTPASIGYLKVEAEDERDHIEVSPSAGTTIQWMADRISQCGGTALVIDYGHEAEKEDTFRGFKNHELHDVLDEPGTADLTADVDFKYLKKQVENKVKVVGPVTQSNFLQNMGIGMRLRILYQTAKEEDKKDLVSGYHMLTSPLEMGERFKVMALAHPGSKHEPVGFDPLPDISEEFKEDEEE